MACGIAEDRKVRRRVIRGLRKQVQSPTLKSKGELAEMRRAGRLEHRILERMATMAVPGVTTAEMNAVAEQMIAEAGAEPLFKGQKHAQARFPFPTALCTSVNDEVVHGIPSDRTLAPGDIVSVDCGVRLNGFCGDAAVTFAIGEIGARTRRLLEVTHAALDLAIREMRPGRWWSEIAASMQALVETAGFSVVREFVGHGIGREMHEEPKVPNYVARGRRREDFLLKPGMTLAVEPMVTMGAGGVQYKDNSGWPVVTRDGSRAAHFEHTLAVTATGVEVLTGGAEDGTETG
ncbi:MAG: type I methionyl aminopeptidase [Phycisphaerae bacterium]|nr:type I methionyl aminopeptidase [Phycisphaerae bacterium]